MASAPASPCVSAISRNAFATKQVAIQLGLNFGILVPRNETKSQSYPQQKSGSRGERKLRTSSLSKRSRSPQPIPAPARSQYALTHRPSAFGFLLPGTFSHRRKLDPPNRRPA